MSLVDSLIYLLLIAFIRFVNNKFSKVNQASISQRHVPKVQPLVNCNLRVDTMAPFVSTLIFVETSINNKISKSTQVSKGEHLQNFMRFKGCIN